MTTITPFLWFDDDLEDALELYCRVFPDAKVLSTTRTPDGKVFTADFVLAGQPLKGLNGGPHFRFNEAISLFVTVDGQDEVDRCWDALTRDGGQESQCGWLKDRFGVSWQVTPTELMTLLADPDPGRAQRATQAMLSMRRIDIAEIKRAADSVPA